MNITKRITSLVILTITITCAAQQNSKAYRSEYYAVLPFWESPYQPVRGACPITKADAQKRIHLMVDFDSINRTIATHVKLGDHYKAFEGRFGNLNINAPLTKIQYSGNKETHTFFDRFENQISVMGDVYQKNYEKDTFGRNIVLTFSNEKGEKVANWFGVVRYQWKHELDGSVIEERLDENGMIVPLRGSFQLLRTRMVFNEQGYVGSLQNIDADGNLINTDSGAAIFQYHFDQQGRFDRWEVFDQNGQRAIGPSHTAGEQNTHYTYDLENIIFYDTELKPATHWSGAQRWHFEIDEFGNTAALEFQNGEGYPMNANGGYAKYTAEWTADGRHLISESYFDENGAKTVHKIYGFHRVEYIRDTLGLILEKHYLDVGGSLFNRLDNGIAIEKMNYTENDSKTASTFFDSEGNQIQNN